MNTLVLALLTDVAGLFYVVSAVIATQASTLWNFCFTELWVFSDRDHKRGQGTRMALFFLMNNAALALRGPLLVLLTSGLGIHYVVSNVISLVGLRWCASRSRIPGSGRRRVRGLTARSVRLRHPRHRQRAVRRPPAGAGALPGRLARRGAGHPRAPGAGRPNGDGPAIRYREGRLGFGLSIQHGRADRGDGLAAGRPSPHVLYTNVVEPILRWTFAERGYALVHAACLAAATTRSWSPPGPTRQDHHEPAAARPRSRTRSSPTT